MDVTKIDLSNPRFDALNENDKGEIWPTRRVITATPGYVFGFVAVTWGSAITYTITCNG
ncbi:hypothetical protein AAH978_15480 [Streptomyces sp. ZYX-F-203]